MCSSKLLGTKFDLSLSCVRIISSAITKRDLNLIEKRIVLEKRAHGRKESIGVWPVHVERAVGPVNCQFIAVIVSEARIVDGLFKLLFEAKKRLPVRISILEVNNDSLLWRSGRGLRGSNPHDHECSQ